MAHVSEQLWLQESHHPASQNHAPKKISEASESISHHVPRGFAMRDTKHDRGKERKYECSAEMIESNGHLFLGSLLDYCFLPIAMW